MCPKIETIFIWAFIQQVLVNFVIRGRSEFRFFFFFFFFFKSRNF